MENNKNTSDPLEELLDRVSEFELDKHRRAKYTRLKADAIRMNKSRKLKKFSGIAAACIIILATTLILFPRKINSTELYQKYFAPHHFQIEYRSTQVSNEEFNTSIRLFEEGKLEKSMLLVDNLLNQDNSNPDLLFLKAQILMQQGKFNLASIQLEQVIKFGGAFKKTGLWYISMCYLFLENFDECLQNLEKLISLGNSGFEKKATSLSREVKKLVRKT